MAADNRMLYFSKEAPFYEMSILKKIGRGVHRCHRYPFSLTELGDFFFGLVPDKFEHKRIYEVGVFNAEGGFIPSAASSIAAG